jgi:pyruvate,water dikinase
MAIETTTPAARFPVEWRLPDDSGDTYFHDPMHFPHPMSPLAESTMGVAFDHGYTVAAKENGLPLRYAKVVHLNHYRFECLSFITPKNEAEAREVGQTLEAHMKPRMVRLLERWHTEHLPALLAHHDRLKSMNPQSRSGEEIVDLIDEADAIHADLWTIHFRIAHPMLMAMQLFNEFCTEIFGEGDADSHAMLMGANSKSVLAGIALSDLAASARSFGLERTILDETGDTLMATLETTENGRSFLESLDAFLEDYGYRQDLYEYNVPTWREDPSIALSAVRNYLRSGHDARAAQMETALKADQAVTRARERLVVYPRAVREQFEAMLRTARHGAFMQEEHNFYIDQQGTALLRLFYLRIGAHLRDRGIIASADDVFMLMVDEIRDLVMLQDTVKARKTARELVAQCRAELEIAATLNPPPFVGSPPADSSPMDNPLARAAQSFFGGPPKRSDDPRQLHGHPGSRGIATGIARVARTLDDASHLRPGEILVATTTMPAWTPLFGVAAAVITETGGVLSHCAIVAREYGLPAVVGAYGAMQRITTGQEITVDGTTGLVTLE